MTGALESSHTEPRLEVAGLLTELRDDAYLLVNLLSWRFTETPETAAPREPAVTMLGEVQVALSSFRTLAIRHPNVDAGKWDEAITAGHMY